MAVSGNFLRSASFGALRLFQAAQCRCSSTYTPAVTFAPGQDGCGEQQIGPLVAEQQAHGSLFYGIEVLARTRSEPIVLDFNRFHPVLPVFVSVVWHAQQYWDVEEIDHVESIVLCKHLAPRVPVMPIITAYRLSQERLHDFLDLNFSNVLALRGDDMHPNQEYQNGLDLVEEAKCRLGDKVSVTVPGFPEGYTVNDRSPEDYKRNMEILKAKVAAGADCIITQTCYRPEAIVKFVNDCRAEGITVPILMGIMAHDTYGSYISTAKRGTVQLTPDLLEELEEAQCQLMSDPSKHPDLIRQFFVRINIRIISHVLSASKDIRGIVFFTRNRLRTVEVTLKELRDLGLLKSPQ